MRVVANTRYISRRATAGRYLSLAGLLVLLAAFIFSWIQIRTPTLMPLALGAALAVGIVLSYVGGYYTERYGSSTAHHLGVQEALKGLDDRYALLQYVLPVPHVLVGPDGVTVFAVRSQPGEITFNDGKWTHRQRGRFFRELAGQERLGRPEVDAQAAAEKIRGYLERRLPGAEVPVRGVVLFVNPDARVEVEDPPVPVFYRKKVKEWLRGPGAGKALPAAVRRGLDEIVSEAEARAA